MKITKTKVMKALEAVLDPELQISIIDLGLIYDIVFSDPEKIKIVITLTAPGCPLVELIEKNIIEQVKKLGFKQKNIKVEITFDPPWSPEKMTKKGKKLLGI